VSAAQQITRCHCWGQASAVWHGAAQHAISEPYTLFVCKSCPECGVQNVHGVHVLCFMQKSVEKGLFEMTSKKNLTYVKAKDGLDEGKKKQTHTHTHKLAQQVIFSESNSLTIKMAELTTTHTTTDLGLWWPYTDQGKPHGE